MKALQKVTITAVAGLALFLAAKFVWVLFWDFLFKIFAVLQYALMGAVVLMAVYVLWKILGYKSSGERE